MDLKSVFYGNELSQWRKGAKSISLVIIYRESKISKWMYMQTETDTADTKNKLVPGEKEEGGSGGVGKLDKQYFFL